MEELETKYNYKFVYFGFDYLMPSFGALKNYPMVEMEDKAFKISSFGQKIFDYQWSTKLNKKFNVPFKWIWYKKLCHTDFKDDKPVCYVFNSGKYILDDKGLFKYIKSLNKDNKCVVYLSDIVDKMGINIKMAKDHTDLTITYDKEDAKKHNITHATNYVGYGALMDVTTPKPNEFENDVYFIGFAKDRLDQIHDIYKFLTANGLKCKFVVCGVEDKDKIDGEGLIYTTPITYLENIKNVQKSKCVLDIVQRGSVGATLRVRESRVYKRKLLSNNVHLREQDFYNEDFMHTFDNIEDINIDFLKADIDYSKFETDLKYDPLKFIKYLERNL